METICGTCNFCIKDDGEPYCVMKNLYTTVDLDKSCDEVDIRGFKMWAEGKER